MRRLTPTLVSVVLVLAACADGPTALSPDPSVQAQFAMGGKGPAPIVIDFESLAASPTTNSNYYSEHQSYQEDGFTLVNLNADESVLTAADAFGSPVAGAFNLYVWYEGSQALFNNRVLGTTRLTKDDGGTFDVLSVDVAEVRARGGMWPRVVPFTGTKADGSTVSVTFTTDQRGGFETFDLTGLTDLVSLSWVQRDDYIIDAGGQTVYLVYQFDNITLQLSPVVEPPTEPGADPQSKADCLKGGWDTFGFKNQGQCVRFVETQQDSRS